MRIMFHVCGNKTLIYRKIFYSKPIIAAPALGAQSGPVSKAVRLQPVAGPQSASKAAAFQRRGRGGEPEGFRKSWPSVVASVNGIRRRHPAWRRCERGRPASPATPVLVEP